MVELKKEFEYSASSYRTDFNAAQKACESWDGNLISIENADEQYAMEKLIGRQGNWLYGLHGMFFWIGLNEQQTEGLWKWTDGTTLSFLHWSEWEPNNWQNIDEDCTFVGWEGTLTWHDAPCNMQSYFICQREKTGEVDERVISTAQKLLYIFFSLSLVLNLSFITYCCHRVRTRAK